MSGAPSEFVECALPLFQPVPRYRARPVIAQPGTHTHTHTHLLMHARAMHVRMCVSMRRQVYGELAGLPILPGCTPTACKPKYMARVGQGSVHAQVRAHPVPPQRKTDWGVCLKTPAEGEGPPGVPPACCQ